MFEMPVPENFEALTIVCCIAVDKGSDEGRGYMPMAQFVYPDLLWPGQTFTINGVCYVFGMMLATGQAMFVSQEPIDLPDTVNIIHRPEEARTCLN